MTLSDIVYLFQPMPTQVKHLCNYFLQFFIRNDAYPNCQHIHSYAAVSVTITGLRASEIAEIAPTFWRVCHFLQAPNNVANQKSKINRGNVGYIKSMLVLIDFYDLFLKTVQKPRKKYLNSLEMHSYLQSVLSCDNICASRNMNGGASEV